MVTLVWCAIVHCALCNWALGTGHWAREAVAPVPRPSPPMSQSRPAYGSSPTKEFRNPFNNAKAVYARPTASSSLYHVGVDSTSAHKLWSRGGRLGYFHLGVSSSPVAIKPSSRDSAQPQPSWHYSPTTTSAQSLRAPRDLWIFCKDWLRDLLNSLHCLPRFLILNTSFTIGN